MGLQGRACLRWTATERGEIFRSAAPDAARTAPDVLQLRHEKTTTNPLRHAAFVLGLMAKLDSGRPQDEPAPCAVTHGSTLAWHLRKECVGHRHVCVSASRARPVRGILLCIVAERLDLSRLPFAGQVFPVLTGNWAGPLR